MSFALFSLMSFEDMSAYDFDAAWKEVEKFEREKLPKSAQEKIAEIYEMALREKDQLQITKSTIYKAKYELSLNEDGFPRAVGMLESEINSAESPAKQVLQIVTARLYHNYLQTNFYKIKQRTALQLDDDKEPENWSVNIFTHRIRTLVHAAVDNPEALDFPLEEYKQLVLNYKKETVAYKPTLYDLVVDQAFGILNTIESFEVQASYMYSLTDEKALGTLDEFLGMNFETRDTNSSVYLNLKLLQKIGEWNKSKRRTTALLETDLQRLTYVYRHIVHAEKQYLYLAQLEQMQRTYVGQPQYSMVLYHLANYYYIKGNQIGDEEYHDNFVKAIKYADEIIEKYPKSNGASSISRIYNYIKQKVNMVSVERIVSIDSDFLAQVKYKNIDRLYLRLIKLTDKEVEVYVDNGRRDDGLKKLLDLKSIREWSIELPVDGAYQNRIAEFPIEGVPNGNYVLISGSDGSFKAKQSHLYFSFFQSTNIGFTHINTKNGSEVRVMDRISGIPLDNAEVEVYVNFYDRLQRKNRTKLNSTLKTNKDGIVKLPANRDQRNILRISYNEDSNYFNQAINNYWNDNRRERTENIVFTDRAIYRPGQTVHYKVLSLHRDKWSVPKIAENNELQIVLRDVNGQELTKQESRTNAYGSAAGSFVLPDGVLKGSMSIQINGSSRHSFRVEEYKRPKFYVEIDTLSEVYQLGEEVTVEAFAKSFSGSVIDGAQVTYRVYRQAHFPYYYWRRPIRSQNEMEITNGQSITDEKGRVKVDFTAIPDLAVSTDSKPVYHYRVVVDITDLNGETQSKSKTIIIGTLSRQIGMDATSEVDIKDEKKIHIEVKDHNGATQASEGVLSIYKLKQDPKFYKNRYWNIPDTILVPKNEFETRFPDYRYNKKSRDYDWDTLQEVGKRNFKTPEEKEFLLEEIIEAGSYVARAIIKEKNGEEIEQIVSFVVYDKERGRYPTDRILYAKESFKEVQPGDVYSVDLGTSEELLHLYYQVEKRYDIVNAAWMTLDKSGTIRVPVNEEDRGGFTISYTYIKNNRAYSGTHNVKVPWKNKELDISFTSIRNTVLPGAQEEIQIKITGEKKDKVAAELLAGMYDASLDEFVTHSWERMLFPQNYRSMNETAMFFTVAHSQQLYLGNRDYSKFRFKGDHLSLPHLNFFDLLRYTSWRQRDRMFSMESGAEPRMYKNKEASSRIESMPTKSIDALAATSAGISADAEGDIAIRGARAGATDYYIDGVQVTNNAEENESIKAVGELSDISVRTNLNETVFFHPNLQTDEEGNVILSYTMNEALTKWNLFAFAHDKDLRYGFAKQEIMTQKDVMVFPNPPRFFRDNDKITFSAKVSNLSDTDLDVDVQLDLYDAMSMEKVDGKLELTDKTQSIKIPAGGSNVVKWNLQIPNRDLDALNYKVLAKAGKHTDGEESIIPVLTDRILVTETMPFTVNPNSKKKVRFEKMADIKSNTLVHENFALEYTSNPAWYAVQALPYLMEYPYKCTEQVMNRYYANTLASYISNSHPKVKAVFDQWKSEDSDALVSNLEKNQELKSALLKETPWVLAAKSETEQKKNIALLFDLNKMSQEKKQAMQTIRDRQIHNGGFPWFNGGRANRYITQNVLENIGHLIQLNVVSLEEDQNLREIVENGIRYMDNEIQKEDQRISNRKEDNLSYLAAHYLYVRSFFKDIEHQGTTKKSFDFFLGKAESHAIKLGIYHTAMLTLVLHRYGRTEKAQALKKSLLERSFDHEELGIYWNEGNGYNWYELPIERHALLLETMVELGESTDTIDKLKLWLLRNKHTNNWKTTKATSAAIYALLIENESTGMSAWITEEDDTEFALAGVPLKFDKQEIGTAYVKKSWSKPEIGPALAELEVTNNNDHVGWGSMYWQYFEEMDKVEDFEETPLKLKKQLYKVVLGDKGEELIPVDGSLQIGDKIKVRIELSVDRTMEYVHMKDMRASGFEPINVLSGYKWNHGLGYYESTGDISTDFFFSILRKGTYVFEYPLRIQHAGEFSNGITTIQCMYAPEYTSHSAGVEVTVTE